MTPQDAHDQLMRRMLSHPERAAIDALLIAAKAPGALTPQAAYDRLQGRPWCQEDQAALEVLLAGAKAAEATPGATVEMIGALRHDSESREVNLRDAFNDWRDSLPKKHWSKYDLSACALGWNAAIDAMLRAARAPSGS
jgi:hypothetical protein